MNTDTAAKVLVLVQGYPRSEDRYNLAYVHTRLLAYAAAGLRVQVLHFGAAGSYVYEGIEVLCPSDWQQRGLREGVLVAHAPNLRSHLRFLLGPGRRFARWLFFFHGHEVLAKQRYYPAPYAYTQQKQGPLWPLFDRAYDALKLQIWRYWLSRWLPQGHLQLVFVSDWMREAMLLCTGLDPALLQARQHVIPNSVHPALYGARWQAPQQPRADCVSFRPLDNPKYAVDQVRELALANPDLRFHVYGRGAYFHHFPAPPNLEWFDVFLTPEAIAAKLNDYRAALMPTRLDAQGVMMCELACSGLPVITSDLPICHEMLGPFARSAFLSSSQQALEPVLTRLAQAPFSLAAAQRFGPAATVQREIQLVQEAFARP
ncbi:MAG: hypothetical protein ACO1RX_08310 [Candidatus Sericytochromatia bacterium]